MTFLAFAAGCVAGGYFMVKVWPWIKERLPKKI
jgi:hypothetical protein